MGKLNYQARKIEGVKAGQVVSKDLKKRVTPGAASKVAARDPTLELDVTGKHLTDEGFDEFIDQLVEGIKFRDEEHPDGAVKLTECVLQGNELTVKSLTKLAEVVALSAGDLRELDISKNNIQIKSPEDQTIWQAFLESFRHCYMLKKLDLGSNALGIAGMEILARVYIQSDLDFVEGDAEAVIGPKQEEASRLADGIESMPVKAAKENEPIKTPSKKTPVKSKGTKANSRATSAQTPSKTVTQADLKHYACTRGLRSIPYLILSNTCTTNVEVIHLVSMMSMQRSSEQLLDFLPPGKAHALPTTVDQCKGIIWLPNDELDASARMMIEMGEAIRQPSAFDSDSEESQEDKTSEGNKPAAQHKWQDKLVLDYKRLAKRVRLDALKKSNVHDVKIWSIAIRMMVVSRALLLEDINRIIVAPPNSPSTSDDESEPEQEEQVPVDVVPEEQEHGNLPLTEPEVSSADPPIDPYDIEFPALEPPKPIIMHKYTGSPKRNVTAEVREKVEVNNEVQANNTTTPKNPTPEPQMPVLRQRKIRRHVRRHSSPVAPQKKPIWRAGLPLHVWRRIIADAVGAEGILSETQQENILKYAADWDVLAYKLTIQGAEDYQQIWKFLETVDCFTYSPQS